MRLRLACAFALALLFPLPAATIAMAEEAGEVNVYSYRQPYLINPLFKAFTEQTGIKVNVIFAEKGLIERIQAEGRNSPADVLLTVDVGNLTQATDAGIAQPIQSPAARSRHPASLSRRRQSMVRAHAPRAGCVRVQREGEARQDHL